MRKLMFGLMLLPLGVLAQKGSGTISEDSIISKWTRAVLNIEVRSKSKTGDSSRGSGTAIYFSYDNKRYLISARHMFVSKFEEMPGQIAEDIFIIKNGSSLITGSQKDFETESSRYARLMMLQVQGNVPFYNFSNEEMDLGVICLNGVNTSKEFIRTIDSLGYVPITLADIDQNVSISQGDQVYAFGFPGDISIRPNPNITSYIWDARSISLPTVSKGEVAENQKGKYYFYANAPINHGKSGGPVVFNNKLVGIVSRFDPTMSQMPTKRLGSYFRVNNLFIKSSYILRMVLDLNAVLENNEVYKLRNASSGGKRPM